MSAVSLHSRVQSSIITREDVSARVETALQTYQPVLQEARAIQPLFEATRNSGFRIAETAELFGRVTHCLADMKPLGEELEKLKAFFRNSLVCHKNDPYQTDDGKRLQPKEWQMHPLTQWGEYRDELLRTLFPRFQEIGTIYHEFMFENEESGAPSLQASLERIRGSLSSVLFPPSPSFIGSTVTSSSPERSSSPSISSASSSSSSISGVSSEDSISVEHQEIQAPSSITNPIFKNGWEKLEEIRLGVASGKSWRDLRSTMKSIESDRIRRLVYKAVAKRNDVWDDKTKGSHWGRANWHKTEQKAVLLQVILKVQAQCEAGTIVLINKG